MSHFSLSTLADSDLDEIWNYIAQDNPDNATQFLLKLMDRFYLLASNPMIGTSRPSFGPGMRMFPYENYSIFYILVEGGVEIIRVLHSARDTTKIFDSDLPN